MGFRIFVAAVEAAVTIVVDGTVANVITVHHIDNLHDHFRVMGRVSIHFDIEDMASACHLMIGSFHFRFVTSAAFVVDGYMIGVCIIVAVRNTGQRTEFLTVTTGKFARQAFGRCCQYAVIMLVFL